MTDVSRPVTVDHDQDWVGQLSDTQVALIRGTYRVITRQGVHRASIQDIAHEAGVSRGLVHYHFGSKEHLLVSTMRWVLLRIGERIHERLAGVDDPKDVLDALIEVLFVGPDENRDFFLLYLELVEHALRVPTFGHLFVMVRQIINRSYEEIIRQGVARGAFRVDDVEEAAIAMRAYIDGIFVLWFQDEGGASAHERYRTMCTAGLMRLLGAA